MARAFLLSHGARDSSEPETFVPEGRSISFYSNYDEYTLRSIGLAAINNGEIAPAETLTGPSAVANYVHDQFEDSAIAQHLASESSATNATPYYVGSDLPDRILLCTTPVACAQSHPQHAEECQGVFRLVAEEEIYSVACRGVLGQQNPATREMEGSTDYRDELGLKTLELLNSAAEDPQGTIEYWETLTDATRAALMGRNTNLGAWIEQYYAHGGSGETEAVKEARRFLEAHGEEALYAWVATLHGRQRELIMGAEDLAHAYGNGKLIVENRQREQLMGDSEAPAGTQAQTGEALAARIDQETSSIAEAVASFGGSEQDDIAGVTQAFEAMMQDIQAYLSLPASPHASDAENLYAAGAYLGQTLAVHQEQHDTESLQPVRSAAGLVAQWGHTLVSQ